VSGTKALEKIAVFPLRWSDLAYLSDHQKAAFSIVSFAVTEINCLMRLYLFSRHDLTGDDIVDYASLAQSGVILRTWSSKLFEVSSFLRFKESYNKTNDATLMRLGKEALDDFKAIEAGSGYASARNFRNEVSSHYSLSAVEKNLEHVSPHANCNMYLHSMKGNSYFPIGDDVVFIGRLNRQGAQGTSPEQERNLYDEWMQWNVDATRWLNDVHLKFFAEFVANSLPGRVATEKLLWLDPRMVGNPSDVRIPVFMRRDP
jgi:hypothetical protein